ncbi:Ferric reductase transmembrane component-like domain [Trinorchestia longiramus]|nr:Ferric reductase transmembrane component-like domain [Trinorchestia longiramus]
MGRRESAKKILDVESGSIEKESKDLSKCRLQMKLHTLLPVRKLGHVNFSDHFITSSWLQNQGITEKPVTKKPSITNVHSNQELKSWSCLKPFKRQFTWLRNNASYVFFLTSFILANTLLFGLRVWQYRHAYIMEIMARAFGQCLNLNCALLLTLILRRSITRLRNSRLGSFLPCDKHVHLHKMAGWAVFMCSILHTMFHVSNLVNLSSKTDHTFWSYLLDTKHGIGWVAGLANQTGIALLLMLFVIVTFSHRCIRKSGYFEVFYFTHLLSLPFWVLLVLHGSNFWLWLLLPGVAFVVESCLRIVQVYSDRGRTSVVAVEELPSQVMKITIQRPNEFEFRAGEYVYLNIPSVAKHEWHPFTISSAPEQEETFSVHVRSVGGWTHRMIELFRDAPHKRHDRSLLEPHGLLATQKFEKKSCSSGSINGETSSVMEGKLESGSFAIEKRMDSSSFENLSSRYHANLIEFNRKTSTSLMQPAVLLLENEFRAQKQNSERTRKRSSSLSSLHNAGSDVGQWTPKMLDSASTSATGSLSSLQNLDLAFQQRLGNAGPVHYSSPSITHKSCEQFRMGPATSIQPVEVFVDGPYGSPSSSITKVNHAVLIAAGIGVTPFASILQSIMCRYRAAKVPCPHCSVPSCVSLPTTLKKLKRVDFVWVNRDISHFEWFLELLASLESEQQLPGAAMEKFLQLQLYNTGDLPLQPSMPLAAAVRQGRPDWDQVFSNLRSQQSKKSKVCVFYCGPPSLACVLRDMCLKYRLEFRREMF